MVTERYSRLVDRVWERIEELTGAPPFYLDRCHIASYCPCCLDGTVMFAFAERPKPTWFPSSQGGGPGCCSNGCTAVEIARAIARTAP